WLSRGFSNFVGDPAIGDGQIDFKRGPGAWFAFNENHSFMLFDDAIDRSQPEPCAFVLRLGGEKWLKNTGDGFFVHALPSVCHAQANVTALARPRMVLQKVVGNENVLRPDGDATSVRH